jgi:hypothetical protein
MMITFPQDFQKIPPFFDAHVHFMRHGHPLNPEEGWAWTDRFLACGIFYVSEMGHRKNHGLIFRKEELGDRDKALTIYSAGYALYKKGTYGGFLGKGISGRIEIRAAIRALAREGVDFIKIINSGIVSLGSALPVTEGGFTDEEWSVIAGEAEENRLPIYVHANADPAIAQALRFGVASIEHGFFITEENLLAMARQGTTWTPTAVALLSQRDFVAEAEKKQLERILEDHLESIRLAAELGVRLKIGTDSGSRGVEPGESYLRELALFQKAGLSQEQILSAACVEKEEIRTGNYLWVEKDFIKKKRIESVFYQGKPLILSGRIAL